jgi:hypothetical protein
LLLVRRSPQRKGALCPAELFACVVVVPIKNILWAIDLFGDFSGRGGNGHYVGNCSTICILEILFGGAFKLIGDPVAQRRFQVLV